MIHDINVEVELKIHAGIHRDAAREQLESAAGQGFTITSIAVDEESGTITAVMVGSTQCVDLYPDSACPHA